MVATENYDEHTVTGAGSDHVSWMEERRTLPLVEECCSVLTSSGHVQSFATTPQLANDISGHPPQTQSKGASVAERALRGEIIRPSLKIQYILPILAKAAVVRDSPTGSAQRITISDRQLEVWTGTQAENTFRVTTGDGYCIVKVLPNQDENGMRRLFLEGSGQDQAEAASMIISGTPFSDSTSDNQYSKVLARTRHVRVENLPKPRRWTIRAFLLYVRAVTSRKHGGSIDRALYSQPGSSYIHAAAAVLCKLFCDDDTKQYISTAALHLALRFCRRNVRVTRAVSIICEGSIAAGIVPDIHCFNEELDRVMSSKSTRLTRQLLQAVLQQRIPLNGTTWRLVMREIESLPLQQQILEVAEQQGFLSTATSRQSIAAAWCKKVFRSIRGEPGALKVLVAHMNQVFGSDWISPVAVTNIIQAGCVVPRNAILSQDIVRFVSQAQSMGTALTDDGLEALLRLLNQPKDEATVLAVLRNQQQWFELMSRSPQVTTRIFVLAWKTRQLNLCRLIWHCAAASGNITHQMAAMLMDSATIGIRHGGTEAYRVWYLIAGKLILGTNLDCSDFAQLFPALYGNSSGRRHSIDLDPRRHLLHSTEDEDAREEQVMLVRLLLERDLHAWRRFEPLGYDEFGKLLDHAIHLDRTSHRKEAIPGTRLSKLMQSVIDVPLTPRRRQIRLQFPELDVDLDGHDPRKWLPLGKWMIDKDDLTWSGARHKDAEVIPRSTITPPRTIAAHFTDNRPIQREEEKRQVEALEWLGRQHKDSNSAFSVGQHNSHFKRWAYSKLIL